MVLTANNEIPRGRKDSGEEESRQETIDEGVPMAAAAAWIERRHYASTAAICICTFTHSWLLVSVFPYSGFMVILLVPGTNEENAGSYAGLLAAFFMVGRAITSYGWGKIADLYGRRIVFFASLALSSLFSLLFGLSSSFSQALLWRFLLGASNGVAGISKTVVTETAQGNEKLETRGMSISMGMWAWGFLLSPAISGFLSDPIRQYPDLGIWIEHKEIYQLLHSYPFFLPNLVSVLLCLIDFIAVMLLVPETLPKKDLRSATKMPTDLFHWLASLVGCRTSSRRASSIDGNSTCTTDEIIPNESFVDEQDLYLESESLLSVPTIELMSTERCTSDCLVGDCTRTANSATVRDSPPEVATLPYLWSKKDTRNHLIVFWMVSFVFTAIDEAFPLFCISKEGGLGLSESKIGKLLSATGVFFAISQYKVCAWVVDRYGLHRSIQVGALMSAPLATFVPVSILLNQGTNQDASNNSSSYSLTWASFVFLSVLLSFMRVFGLVFFSNIAIATNRTVIPSHRGTMNGLSMLGGSITKGLGPIVAGLLMSFGVSSGVFAPKVGAAVVFVLIGGCSAAIVWLTVCLLGDNNHNHNKTTENLASNRGDGESDHETDAFSGHC